MTEKKPQPMKEPMKPHGDKIKVLDRIAENKQTGGAGEPQSSKLDPK
jgi:hypothetical protein